MIAALLVVGWFCFGILGVFLGDSSDYKDGIKIRPYTVFISLGGPITFAVVMLQLIVDSLE